ncbi:MAG: hypothetical protein AAFU79_00365, partial [Myxococcota bacterium]
EMSSSACLNPGREPAKHPVEILRADLVMHYSRVGQVLEARRPELEKTEVSTEYLDRMLGGLSTWVEAGRAGHLAWGIINLRR